MKIFDCFMYFNEDVVLDVRFNYLDKFVDKFVIVESTYNHRGQKKKLNVSLKEEVMLPKIFIMISFGYYGILFFFIQNY